MFIYSYYSRSYSKLRTKLRTRIRKFKYIIMLFILNVPAQFVYLSSLIHLFILWYNNDKNTTKTICLYSRVLIFYKTRK